jgi:hypothetical protein
MGRKDQKKLKNLPRVPNSYIYNALVAESDRGCVIVGCAFLEHHLDLLL